MFIELNLNGVEKSILINVEDINTVEGIEDYSITKISFWTDNTIIVKESYDRVKKLIKQEVAAERGY